MSAQDDLRRRAATTQTAAERKEFLLDMLAAVKTERVSIHDAYAALEVVLARVAVAARREAEMTGCHDARASHP